MDLSIIIVNKDSGDMLQNTVKSILNSLDQIKYEIFIIDNASADNSIEKIAELSTNHDIKIIHNKENIGFAAGNNQGIRMAKGGLILLINHDILLREDTIKRSVSFINEDKDIGAMGCRLINEDGSWQRSYGCSPTLLREFFEIFSPRFLLRYGILPSMHGYREYRTAKEVDWISGAFFMVRREILEETGYLDERFFMYFEDIDLCKRIREAGKKVYYSPYAEAYHIHTKKNISGYSLIDNGISPYLYFHKHYGRLSVPILWIMTIIKTSLRTAIFFTRHILTSDSESLKKGKVNRNTLLFNLKTQNLISLLSAEIIKKRKSIFG